jgi:RHS repeat-associated protein
MGSLIFESRDASGLYYRRNRYYDSEKGRFTQEDPIGLAGGVNVYGFANGDPVSYSDPYGLCPRTLTLAPAAAADGPLPVVDAALAVSCVIELGMIGFRLYRTARAAESAAAALAGGAVATKSHTTAQVEIDRRYGEVRVDWEESTSGGDPGNVHVQNKNGRVNIGKIYIQTADDLTALPEVIRNNERILRGIRRALEQLERHRQSQPSTPPN